MFSVRHDPRIASMSRKVLARILTKLNSETSRPRPSSKQLVQEKIPIEKYPETYQDCVSFHIVKIHQIYLSYTTYSTKIATLNKPRLNQPVNQTEPISRKIPHSTPSYQLCSTEQSAFSTQYYGVMNETDYATNTLQILIVCLRC